MSKGRRIPHHHPNEPMQIDEVVQFHIKDTVNCTLTGPYFTVLKESFTLPGDDITNLIFYAMTGNFYEDFRNGSKMELPGATRERKYEKQIAFIECYHGWIQELNVFDKNIGKEGPFEDPRMCGIGTILAELCLIDPEINVQKEGNKAGEYISYYQGPEVDFIPRYCRKLVGLRMTATPIAAGRVYFSAAIQMKYERVIIDSEYEFTIKAPSEYDIDDYPIKFYEPEVAKANFIPDTGIIKPCGCNRKMCRTYPRRWFFCGFTS